MTKDCDKLQAMSFCLIGLAILQQNQKTHVNYEIAEILADIKEEIAELSAKK